MSPTTLNVMLERCTHELDRFVVTRTRDLKEAVGVLQRDSWVTAWGCPRCDYPALHSIPWAGEVRCVRCEEVWRVA